MSGTGYKVDPEELAKFGRHLDTLSDDLRGIAEVIGSCVADPGIFGVVGQLFGAGASDHCAKARDQFNTYADSIVKFRENLDKSKQNYQTQEDEVADSISGHKV